MSFKFRTFNNQLDAKLISVKCLIISIFISIIFSPHCINSVLSEVSHSVSNLYFLFKYQ